MKQNEMAKLMDEIFAECNMARTAGQKEYAHDTDNAFRNFEFLARELGLDRKMVLWVYMRKHIDGILSYINGHRSQREDVRGRIKDTIVYLCLLWGMIDEEQEEKEKFLANVVEPKERMQEAEINIRRHRTIPVNRMDE